MPREDDDFELDSSAGSTDLDATDATNTAQVEAGSSAADGETEAKDTLDLVRDVVEGETEGEEAEAASPAEGEEAGEETGDQQDDPEDFSDVPFNKHPRFRKLVADKKAAEVDAARYRNVQGFLDTHGLSAEDAGEALIVAGLMRSDPVAAWHRLRPLVQQLLVAAGEVLPDDLNKRVEAGELPPEAAQEISRHRAHAQSVETRQVVQREQAERQQRESLSTALYGAAQAWEDDRRAKDPNFDAKLVPLHKELAYLHATEGKPTTAQGVRGQLKRAYDAVSAAYVPPAPARPTATRPATRPITGGQVSGAPRAPAGKELSTLDIIRQHAG